MARRKPTELSGDQKRAAERAADFRQLRRDYLFSQRALAEALAPCSRRTIVAIETGGREVVNPHPDLLRRFRDLKRRLEAEFGKNAVA